MSTSAFIDLDGPVHYQDHGGDGPPVVLLHGLGSSHLNWEGVGPRLAAHHRVYALDLAGFGLTPPAGRRTTVRANQRLVDAFCRAVAPDAPVVVMGHSMGGLIALLQADANPEAVAALVLVAPALPLVDLGGVNAFTLQRVIFPTFPGVGEAAMRRYYATTGPEEVVRDTIATITANPDAIPEEHVRASIEMQRIRRDMEWMIPAFISASRSIAAALSRPRAFRKMLHRVAAPTLLIHGDEDTVVGPNSARWVAKQRPDWQFQMFHGVGHVPMIEAPEGFADVVDDFLVRQARRRRPPSV